MNSEAPKQTLYSLIYHEGAKEITRSTVAQLEFFYAADEGEARAKADKLLSELPGPVWEEELKVWPDGCVIITGALPGNL
jgi:hypothetical protein